VNNSQSGMSPMHFAEVQLYESPFGYFLMSRMYIYLDCVPPSFPLTQFGSQEVLSMLIFLYGGFYSLAFLVIPPAIFWKP